MTVEKPVEERLDEWIRTMELLATRQPRRYDSLVEAEARMRDANPRLSAEMASHLTLHGTMRMEDGTYAWKFDNYVRAWGPNRYDREAVRSWLSSDREYRFSIKLLCSHEFHPGPRPKTAGPARRGPFP